MTEKITQLFPGQAEESAANKIQRRSQIMGMLVLAAIVLPMLAAYLIFKTGFGVPTGTVNKGELIVPATQLSPLSVVDLNRESLELVPAGSLKWRLIIANNGDCGELCQQQLYKARQVHKRLGDKAHRVERIFIATSSTLSDSLQELLREEYPGMQVVITEADQWQQLFTDTDFSADLSGQQIVVVDQQGFAMMHFDTEHKGGAMLDDLKRLLKYSYEG